jgi:hypothetical protein
MAAGYRGNSKSTTKTHAVLKHDQRGPCIPDPCTATSKENVMTSIGKPLTQHLLSHFTFVHWLIAVTPDKPRLPTEVEIAHACRADLSRIDAPTQRDIGLSASDATGISSYQEALPFFMQAGFK